MDEARSFKKLEKSFGMKASEIAAAMGKDVKVVRERLKLLRLPLEIQEKVHLGKMAQKKALALLEGDKTKVTVSSPDPRRLPSIKEVEKLFNSPQDQLPDEYAPLITEAVRQLFAHWLRVKYAPRAEVRKTPMANQPASNQPA